MFDRSALAVLSMVFGPVVFALSVGVPSAGWADDDPALPDFATCMDLTVARFERELGRVVSLPQQDRDFDIGDVRGVDFCGTVGIVRCDRTDDPIPCQHDLRSDQDALRERVMADLPQPQSPPSQDASWPERLYAQVWVLARGTSAGPDCAGMDAQLEAWCEAREANSRLRTTVLAWQVARYLGTVPTAIETGWARVPPPTRPKARPRAGQ
jgi:hypothetical protein